MKKTLLLCLLCAFLFPAYAQDNLVKVLTGDLGLVSDYAGDGMRDTFARYNKITSVASDTAGNLYIYDQLNYRIRKIDAVTHLVTTIGGNGTAGFSGDGGPAVLGQIGSAPAYIYNAGGHLCANPNGDVYFYDYGNQRIRKIDHLTGILSTLAGGGSSTADSVDGLSASIYATSIQYYNGYIYFADHNYIRRLNLSDNMVINFFGPVLYENYIAIDKHGNVLIANNELAIVQKVNTAGVATTIAGIPSVRGVSGDGGPAVSATLSSMFGISVDTSDNVYVGFQSIVRKIDAQTGYIHTIIGNAVPEFDLSYYGTASNSFSFFPSYNTPIKADVYQSSLYPQPYCMAGTGKLICVAQNRIVEYMPGGYSINDIKIKDTLLSVPCTLPSQHRYYVYGTLTAAPATSDSLNISITYHDGAVATYKLPYHTYTLPGGGTGYAFGDTLSALTTHSFSYPDRYAVYLSLSTGHGCTNMLPALDTVGTTCNYSTIDNVFIGTATATITSPPCSPMATVAVYANFAASLFSGEATILPTDSVYVLFDFMDGTTETQVIPYTEYGYAEATAYHNYPMGTTEIQPVVTATMNSGIFKCTTFANHCGTELPIINIPDCSVPALPSSTFSSDGSGFTACTTPYNAQFMIGSALSGTSIADTALSYYINFGDGADTTVVLPRLTDGIGNYFMSDTIAHTYYMPGAYTVAVTPSDGTGTILDSSLNVGTSCAHLSGVFYRDGNANCTADSGELRLGFWPMAIINNTLHDTTYAWCDTFGHYALSLIDGHDYSIIPDYFGYFGYGTDSFVLSCPSSGVFNITAVSGSSYTQDFGFICAGSPAEVDMHVSGWAWGVIPGDTGVVGIWSSNDWAYMCDSLNSTVTLTLDPLLTYIGMWDGPMPTSVTGNTLTWDFHTVASMLDFHADVKVTCATTATMGASVCNTLQVSPTSLPDGDITNNTYSWCEPVRSSWDPNEKQVSPKGYGTEGYIPNGTPLTYVVHFQNTGTARARNITINDTISNNLDLATLQVVSSSAPVLLFQPELSGNLVKFRFNDINLPDSNTDKDGSNGYVEYSIYPKPTLAAGTQIENRAGIYFDYNPAVVTNTTLNTIEGVLEGIDGNSEVCVGASTTLTSTLTGGVWSSHTGRTTVVDGVVTGVSAGLDTISYTMYGGEQVAYKIITVTTATPDAGTITGMSSVCTGADITLSNTVPGGTWSSSSASATVAGGVVSGVSAGNTIISYTVNTACGSAIDTMAIIINAQPDAGTITGASSVVCVGSNLTLSNTATGGTWSSSSSAATVTGGIVSGVSAGDVVISYTATNICGSATDTMQLSVNAAADAGTITGLSSVCAGVDITLSNAVSGGVWSSSSASATVAGGVVSGVSAGSTIISYTVSNACGSATDTMAVTINALPDAGIITGPSSVVCIGTDLTLSNTATGGAWSSSSSAATVTGGIVSGVSAGDVIISYTATNMCGTSTDTMQLSVNAAADAGTITGLSSVCVGTDITLSNAVSGGTWSSSSSEATVTGGVVSGVSAGSVIISYTVSNVCNTAIDTMQITVTDMPSAGTITGTTSLCVSNAVSLTTTGTGGAWSSSNTAMATIDASGVVTPVSAGNTTISYIAVNACGADTATLNLTINAMPDAGVITGANTLCPGDNITLLESVSGGTWISTNDMLATVSAGGVVSGIASGSVNVLYVVSNICGADTESLTVIVPGAGSCPDGVAEVGKDNNLQLYPNPNGGTFTITGSWTGNTVQMEVIDMLGQVVYKDALAVNNGEVKTILQLSGKLAAGNYLVKLGDDKRQQILRCVIKD